MELNLGVGGRTDIPNSCYGRLSTKRRNGQSTHDKDSFYRQGVSFAQSFSGTGNNTAAGTHLDSTTLKDKITPGYSPTVSCF